MSSEKEFFESAMKGGIKGALEWTEEKIKEVIRKFVDRDLYFVEDLSTIEYAKEQRKKGEYVFFITYVKNKTYRVLVQMGLTLRGLEKKREDFRPLKTRILDTYKEKGLHSAQFVQNGIFSKYIGVILEGATSEKEIGSRMEELFDNIESTVAFIKNTDVPSTRATEIVIKIQAHSPDVFVLSGIGIAIPNCEEIKNTVMKHVSSDYNCEQYLMESKGATEDKRIYFLRRVKEEL